MPLWIPQIDAIEELDRGLRARVSAGELDQQLDAVSKAVDAVQNELIVPK